jgi:hypothetical protein
MVTSFRVLFDHLICPLQERRRYRQAEDLSEEATSAHRQERDRGVRAASTASASTM